MIGFLRPWMVLVTMGRLFDPYVSDEWIPTGCRVVHVVSTCPTPRVFPSFRLRPHVELDFITSPPDPTVRPCPYPLCMILTFPHETPDFVQRGDGQLVILEAPETL